MSHDPLLRVEGLSVVFRTRHGTVEAVKDVSFSVGVGETVAVVGESGSGKSVTAYSILGLLERTGRIDRGRILFAGVPLTEMSERRLRAMRGHHVSIIFQNPQSALNPIRAVGRQLEDTLIEHTGCRRAEATRQAIDMLRAVKIARPEERYHAYPFELSGGMAQRVMIAIAMICRPKLMIADEPTTGIDVTTQKTIMDMVVDLCRSQGMGVLLITHDLGLAAKYADRIVVMKDGLVAEQADVKGLFAAPNEDYTRRLIRATPRPDSTLPDLLVEEDRRVLNAEAAPAAPASGAPAAEPLLRVEGLVREFHIGARQDLLTRLLRSGRRSSHQSGLLRAVDDVSFRLMPGESLGIVGESGSGKTTAIRMIARLLEPTSGAIGFAGQDIGTIPVERFLRSGLRGDIQMVFQDPTASLNPRFTAFRSIADPLLRAGGVRRGKALRERVEAVAATAGLESDLLPRFPHQLSGGQKARVGIARAIALDPKLLILDEPTTALDVSVQAVVLNQLARLRAELGLSFLFVSHDLNVVRLICDRVLVMHNGRVIEEGDVKSVLSDPRAPYTRALIEAIPHLDADIPGAWTAQ